MTALSLQAMFVFASDNVPVATAIAVGRKTRVSRSDLIDRVKRLAPWAEGEASPIRGGRDNAIVLIDRLDIDAYGKTRNSLDGAVLRVSPYIRHGVVTLAELRDRALDAPGWPEKFIQQLAWRDYFQRRYRQDPDGIWDNQEEYKTGFTHDDYADDLPEDITNGETGVAAMDGFIAQLLKTGYLHNHARLYLASYVVHWRRVKWQTGARWFLSHLLDGDPASNNYSWQWVASTFANKPYYFNLDNLQHFAGDVVDTSYHRNKPLAGSYEDIKQRLFPNVEQDW